MADFVSHSLFRRVIARLDCTRIVLQKKRSQRWWEEQVPQQKPLAAVTTTSNDKKNAYPLHRNGRTLTSGRIIYQSRSRSNKSIKRLSFRFCLSPWLASVLSCRLTNNIKTIRQNRMRSAWRMRKPIRHPKDSIRNSLSKGKKKTFGRILPEWKSL